MDQSRRYAFTLSLGALGVIFGAVGTSPLYALKESFMAHHGHRIAVNQGSVFGILSLITWALILLISIKYLLFVLRADNRGEGGVLALMSMMRPREAGRRGVRRHLLIGSGLFGTALLYGDAMITPAITMLGAFEGIGVASPGLRAWILPLTIVALLVLFLGQKYGTQHVEIVFGPLMLVWFTVLAALGIHHIAQTPQVLAAVNPWWALRFLIENPLPGYLVFGAVFLVVTGGEVLYADMGHAGVRRIRSGWFGLVLPALLLNYFGQGALLLRNPAAASDPFFSMAPLWARWPLVVLSVIAATVASQAMISVAYLVTRSAVHLGYLPRMRMRHTSERQIERIYIPSVNWLLMVGAVGLVAGFGKATSLAGAYGVAVTATMVITTALFAVVARERFNWSMPAVLGFAIPFLVIDLAFLGANLIKIGDGGWFPIVIGLAFFTMMSTWFTGRRLLAAQLEDGVIGEKEFVAELAAKRVLRVRGTAVFLTREHKGIPTALLHNIKHNKVVHQRVVLLSVIEEESPHLTEKERFEWFDVGEGLFRLVLHFGFMEDPDIPKTLDGLPLQDAFNPMSTSYFLGRETLVPTDQEGIALWREHLFAMMAKNATTAANFFNLPANQVIELGAQVRM